jgi:tRNA(Ile)-lysidine synthase
MVATRRLTDLVATALSELKLPEGRLTVALSGGADSGALAYLLHELGREMGLVHIDHQLEASPAMAGAAGEIAEKLGVPLETFTVDVEPGASLEARARDARYGVLETLDAAVVTGHTRDDQVETMLINLIRGSGPRGLAGIPRFRTPNIHRPMLEITRSETREIATLAGLPFVDDPMNEDMALTRNRIRLQILPLMREFNPQLDAALARTAEMIEADVGFIDDLASDHQTGVLPVSLLLTLPKVLADRLLHDALENASITPTADRIGRMWSVARGESKRQDVADGRAVIHRGALLVIE